MIIAPIIRTLAKVATVALYAVTIAASFGGYVNPFISVIPAIATLAFPFLAALTAAATLVWFIDRRWIIGVLGILTLFASGGALKANFPTGSVGKANHDDVTFSLMTYNIAFAVDLRPATKVPEGVDTTASRGMTYVLQADPDILCLQEFKGPQDEFSGPQLSDEQKQLLEARYPYHEYGSWYTDITIFSKYPIRNRDIETPRPQKYYKYFFRVYEIDIKGRKLNLANVHLYSYRLDSKDQRVLVDARSVNGAKKGVSKLRGEIKHKLDVAFRGRADQVKDIVQLTEGIKGPFIVCGDFNDVPASWAWRTFINAGFKDAYAETNFGWKPTFNHNLLLFHIDQVLYRGNVMPISVTRGDVNSSDHYPLLCRFALPPQR